MKPRKPAKPARDSHKDALLDEALAATFPASDPPAMLEPAPRQKPRPRRKKPRRR